MEKNQAREKLKVLKPEERGEALRYILRNGIDKQALDHYMFMLSWETFFKKDLSAGVLDSLIVDCTQLTLTTRNCHSLIHLVQRNELGRIFEIYLKETRPTRNSARLIASQLYSILRQVA